MKRMNCYFLLLAASLCVLPLHAQKEYPIDRITAINLGDGRILHREISGDKPLDGEHRIIDGYHSAYILARFKDGLYNGDYEEYIYNKLKAKGSYKEGWKDGTFRKYDDEGRVTEEKSYKSGKLDGATAHSTQTGNWKWNASTKKESKTERTCTTSLTVRCEGNTTIRTGSRPASSIPTSRAHSS